MGEGHGFHAFADAMGGAGANRNDAVREARGFVALQRAALARGRLSRQDSDGWSDVRLSGSVGDRCTSESRSQEPGDGDEVSSVVGCVGCSDGCSSHSSSVQDHGETVEISRVPTAALRQDRTSSHVEARPGYAWFGS